MRGFQSVILEPGGRTFQVVIFRKFSDPDVEESAGAIWTSDIFTSRRAAGKQLHSVRSHLKSLDLWQMFQTNFEMSVEPNQ